MQLSTAAISVRDLLPWREKFRQEMHCQVVHDSLHAREGWTQSYQLSLDSTPVGYGAVLLGGPWKGTRTVFEFYVAPEFRTHAGDLFQVFAASAAASAFVVQTNDALLTGVLQPWVAAARCEKIVFHDKLTTALPAHGAVLRRAGPGDAGRIFPHHVEPIGDWLLEQDATIVATGGILFHYNRPYGDIHMEVAAPFRRRGFGSYLVQELKRICREGGSVPCARCSPNNLASHQTIVKAGFVECAKILSGPLPIT